MQNRIQEKQQQFCVTTTTNVFGGVNVPRLLLSFLVCCSADAGRPLCQRCAQGSQSPELIYFMGIARLFVHCTNFWFGFIHRSPDMIGHRITEC